MNPSDIKRELELAYAKGYLRGAEAGKKEGERHGYRAGLMDASERMQELSNREYEKARVRRP
jgi:flagellar biosynthesis/type III secretory pathway protein FliH